MLKVLFEQYVTLYIRETLSTRFCIRAPAPALISHAIQSRSAARGECTW